MKPKHMEIRDRHVIMFTSDQLLRRHLCSYAGYRMHSIGEPRAGKPGQQHFRRGHIRSGSTGFHGSDTV